MLRGMRTLPLVLLLVLPATGLAHAEGPPAAALAALRLEARASRRVAGFWLVAWGGASTVAGAAVAIAGHDNQAVLAAGITTASFGLINAALSIGLFDLSGAQAQRIRREATQTADYARLRDEAIAAELQSGQFYAVNTGLDVAYIATGVLMLVLGVTRSRSDAWEKGVGIAFMSQGAWLLAFDIISWIAANQRAALIRSL